jgi:hypothetical protein
MPGTPTTPGVYTDDGRRSITGVPTSVTAFVGRARGGPVETPIEINSFAEFERDFGGLWTGSALGYAVRDFYDNGGSRAIVVRLLAQPSTGVESAPLPDDDEELTEESFIGSGTAAARAGLYALEKADLFNLLCIPPYHAVDGVPHQDVDEAVIAYAARYCEMRRAFLVLDPPHGWQGRGDAVAGLDRLPKTTNAAVYFPRLMQADPLRNREPRMMAPCGAIAGIIARTDSTRGVWKAPAGLDAVVRGAAGLSIDLSDAENDELNRLGINCLRRFPEAGFVVWGARTLRGDDRLNSVWKFIPVRRLALFVEESLYRGTRWVVSVPGGEPLWAHIRDSIGVFMQDLFRQGALQGTKPEDAWFVKCDRETMTQKEIDLGIVNILVGFAPLKPRDFVVIRIQQVAAR